MHQVVPVILCGSPSARLLFFFLAYFSIRFVVLLEAVSLFKHVVDMAIKRVPRMIRYSSLVSKVGH